MHGRSRPSPPSPMSWPASRGRGGRRPRLFPYPRPLTSANIPSRRLLRARPPSAARPKTLPTPQRPPGLCTKSGLGRQLFRHPCSSGLRGGDATVSGSGGTGPGHGASGSSHRRSRRFCPGVREEIPGRKPAAIECGPLQGKTRLSRQVLDRHVARQNTLVGDEVAETHPSAPFGSYQETPLYGIAVGGAGVERPKANGAPKIGD